MAMICAVVREVQEYVDPMLLMFLMAFVICWNCVVA